MRTPSPIPPHIAASAAFLTADEQDQLWRAAIIMADSRGFLVRLTSLFGRRIHALRTAISQTGERYAGPAWGDFQRRAQDAVEDALWAGYDYAILGLEAAPPDHLAHRLATTASGAASGFIGLPGMVFDIPFTTFTILRAIAAVAREAGEDLTAAATRRACLEVLAYAGPSSADDETEIGYWATRLGANHLTLNLLIKNAASRLGLVLSEKLLAQAVPVAGALTGGLLNYAFTDYFQNMARIKFCLRALERRTNDAEALHQVFTLMVQAARDRRRVSRQPPKPAPIKYLPRPTIT